jgi:hypothetical protein
MEGWPSIVFLQTWRCFPRIMLLPKQLTALSHAHKRRAISDIASIRMGALQH